MDKINFEDLPSQNSPINAKNLNQVQTNAENAINEVQENLEELKISSTEEKIVGSWINGKPIYRKTLTIGEIDSQGQQVWDLTDLSIDVFFVNHNRSNYQMSYPASYVLPLANSYKTSIDNHIDVLYIPNSKSLYVRTNAAVKIASGYITIEYTKTTD